MSNDRITKIIAALYTFFSSFGIPAYAEDSVPDDATLPYITYQIAVPEWKGKTALYARVWYRSESFEGVGAKAGEIDEAIGEGVCVPVDGGAVYLYKETPFSQFMPQTGDLTLKCMYLSMSMLAHV